MAQVLLGLGSRLLAWVSKLRSGCSSMSFLSVVVATWNRADTLCVTLDRLAEQTLPRDKYEVIVVDDGSPDNTEQVVRDYMKTAPFALKYFRHENRGPGYTENRGIREAQGPWILLIADDIHCEPTMLEEHYKTHEQHPEPQVAVGGKVLQSPDLPRTVFLQNWDPFRYGNFEALDELTYINFWACNVSFKKAFMLEYGMFIERPGAAHEDTEVGWRLYKNGGLRLLYNKKALAYHYHIETIDNACKRAYERGLKFDSLTDSVNDPGLYVRSHVLTWKTLPFFIRSCLGYKDCVANILDEDKNIHWFIVRELIRRVLFNRVTVVTYVPVIRHAEHSRFLALLVKPIFIRATVSYHFLKGLRALRRRRAAESKPLPV